MKINKNLKKSKWIKVLKVIPKTLKMLEESVGSP